MKKLIMLFVVLSFLVLPVVAEETGGANYTSPNGYADGLADLLNDQEYIDHTHAFDVDRKDQAGIGVDLVVWENEKETVAVEVQEKYDFNNSENAVYAVAKVNLWKILKKDKE